MQSSLSQPQRTNHLYFSHCCSNSLQKYPLFVSPPKLFLSLSLSLLLSYALSIPLKKNILLSLLCNLKLFSQAKGNFSPRYLLSSLATKNTPPLPECLTFSLLRSSITAWRFLCHASAADCLQKRSLPIHPLMHMLPKIKKGGKECSLKCPYL